MNENDTALAASMREKKWIDGKPYDPNGFDSIAEEIYKPCYSMIGQQIMRRTGKSGGDCADIGSGGGHLGIALQSMGNFRMTFVDILPEAIELARKRSDSLGFAEKNSFVVGDVHSLPFPENSFDLIVSRGSLWFWDDPLAALRSLYGTLKPGGALYVGGGFGDAEISGKIHRIMEERSPGWGERRDSMTSGHDSAFYRGILPELGCDDWEIFERGREFWIHISRSPLKRPTSLDFLGYAYCPVKQVFSDMCSAVIEREWNPAQSGFSSYLPSGCNLEDPWEFVHFEKCVDALPSLIASIGYGDFWSSRFMEAHVDTGHYVARDRLALNPGFRDKEVRDPENRYGIYAASPLVMLVEPALLGGLPVPKTIMDLCDPVYRGMICTSSSHGDVHDDVLVQLYADGGRAAVAAFAANVGRSLHSAQISKRAGTDHEERSAICLITWFFARSCPKRDRIVIVWPKDGAPSTPFYYLVKKEEVNRLSPLIDLLESKTLGQAFADQGFPSCNPEVDNKIPEDAYIRLPPVGFVRSNPAEETRARLVSYFFEAWWATHPGRRNPCD